MPTPQQRNQGHTDVDDHGAASTHNPALSALLVRYREMRHTERGTIASVPMPTRTTAYRRSAPGMQYARSSST